MQRRVRKSNKDKNRQQQIKLIQNTKKKQVKQVEVMQSER